MKSGYGILTLFGRDYRAHRLSLGFTGQLIPNDKFVCYTHVIIAGVLTLGTLGWGQIKRT